MSISRWMLTPLVGALVLVGAGCSKKVPDLSGMTRQEAEAALEKKDLKLGRVTTGTEEGANPGTVIDQDPKPKAALPENKTVAIVLQKGGGGGADSEPSGDGTVAVPDVVGKTQDDAELLLQRAGLLRGELNIEVNDKPAGLVFSQDPQAGTQVAEGAVVNISVASDTFAQVPDVIGQPQGRAERLIVDRGFVVGSVTPTLSTSGQASDTVLEQNPSAGLRVAKGQPVSLKVKQDAVTVPDVVGRKKQDAQLTLFQRGLRPVVWCVQDVNGPWDIVKSQLVAPNTTVAKHSDVGIKVSQHARCSRWGVRVFEHRAAERLRGIGGIFAPLNP